MISSPQNTVCLTLHRGDILFWMLNRLWRLTPLWATLVFLAVLAVPTHSNRRDFLEQLSIVGLPLLIWLIIATPTVMLGKGRGLLGEHVLTITDEGLVERTDAGESLYRWKSFHKVKSTRRYFYIYVTDVFVQIVPKRIFASRDEAQSFRNEIESRIKAAPTATNRVTPANSLQ